MLHVDVDATCWATTAPNTVLVVHCGCSPLPCTWCYVLSVYCGCSPTATSGFCSSPVCETEGWAAWGVWSNTAQIIIIVISNYKSSSEPEFEEKTLWERTWLIFWYNHSYQRFFLSKWSWSDVEQHPWYWYCMRSIEGEGGSNKSAINISPPTIKYTSSWGYTAN